MNIIELAKEAGFFEFNVEGWSKEFERFAALVAAREREACAKVCDDMANNPMTGVLYSWKCAAAIRARGEK